MQDVKSECVSLSPLTTAARESKRSRLVEVNTILAEYYLASETDYGGATRRHAFETISGQSRFLSPTANMVVFSKPRDIE